MIRKPGDRTKQADPAEPSIGHQLRQGIDARQQVTDHELLGWSIKK